MKKTIGILATTLLAWSAYTQGTVDFKSPTGTYISNALTSARAIAGTTFRVALYYLPDQATAPTTADFDARGIVLGTFGNPGPVAGVWSAGTRSTPDTTAGGSPAWFQVRAWEAAFGSTYEQAAANNQAQGGRLALVGTSNIILVTTGNPSKVPPDPAAGLAGLQSFYLVPVPEPSVIGLGILGVGTLLLLRRRK